MSDLNYLPWFGCSLTDPAKTRQKGLPALVHPIWTENKAKLIERYLYYFAYVTKHGTYLDAFAGPQREDGHEMWAAKLVLDNRPRWIRHFHLFELRQESVKELENLRDSQPPLKKGEHKRSIEIYPGDCNQEILKFLAANPIKDTEATFCLLDQRTFECDWATVEALARHKQGGNKIELFYFLANGWIHRAQSRMNNREREMERWWGNKDWEPFFKMPPMDRYKLASQRFIDELGYKYSNAFPIHQKKEGGRTLYWMIHATDEPIAPVLMNRAYRKALNVKEKLEQIALIGRNAERLASELV